MNGINMKILKKNWELILSRAAKDYIKKITDKNFKLRIEKALQDIKDNPYSGEKMNGGSGIEYKYKFLYAGKNYRVAYEIQKKEIIIYIVKVGPRENFYDNL